MVVGLSGILVMIGWICDIGFLKCIHHSWSSMKFDTAFCFLLSGIMLFYITRAQEGEFDKAQVVISITSLILVLIMGVLFFSSIFRIQTGAEHLFITEAPGGVKTVIPGRPSVPTIINFLLIAVSGMLTILHVGKVRTAMIVAGLFITSAGLLAIAGYIIDFPLLYYYIEGVNSAMAFHTAILFILLGVGLICL